MGGSTIAEELRALPLLESLDDAQLAELLAVGDERRFTEGQVLFQEGEIADSWLVLL